MSAAIQTSAPPEPAARGQNRALVLAVIVTVQLMIILDGTVVNVALPDIQKDLGFSDSTLSWVVNAYALTFGGLLLLGGRAGDILGRRRTFSIGVVIFTIASFLGGIASSGGLLLAARAIQGIGAAIAAPSVLALIATNFAEGEDRNKALGIFTAVSAAGGSIGLILGGALTDLASWRWVLFINVPIGIAVALVTPRFVAETPRHPGRFDLAGAILSTAGVSSLVYGFIRASQEGWGEAGTLVAFAAGIVLVSAFIVVERSAAQPIVPLRLFAKAQRAVSFAAMLLIPAALLGHFYLVAQFLQNVLGYSPLETGFAFMPLTIAIFALGQLLPRYLPKYGPRPFLIAGLSLITLGLVLLSLMTENTQYASGLLVPIFITGLGGGLAFLPLSIVILEGVPEEDSGAASGLLQAAQQVGAALGVAILVSVFVSASGGVTAGSAAASATVDGVQAALRVAGVFAAAALVLVTVFIRPGGGPAPEHSIDGLEFEPSEGGLGAELAARAD